MKTEQSKRLPLAPYRVIDLTDESGDFCTKILAALGADVIRVEPPNGDATRNIGPFYHDEAHPEKSLHWFTYNLNKRSVTLNIESETGRELFRRLAATADFLVECFSPGYLDSLDIGYRALSQANPRLVFTSITPFGAEGPYAHYKGSHLVTSASSGYMYMCGDEDRPPVQITVPVSNVECGLHAAAGTLMAHWHRQKTGEGQHVDVSAQESFMSQMLPRPLIWKSHGIIPHRGSEGAVIPGRAPYMAIMKAKDGLVVVATTIARGRKALREWMAGEGKAGDLTDPSWDPIFNEGKPVTLEEKKHIDGLFREFVAEHTAGELMFEAQKRQIQLVRLQDVRGVFEDPHLRERRYFAGVEHPELGVSIAYPGAPFKSDEMDWSYQRRAPFIGEHNAEIFTGELGLTAEEIAAMKEGGVI
ncbi:MAG: CoA transferase [Chloroflexi bacterium]|nr:CoA transferase [Chloroflexota bacterium]